MFFLGDIKMDRTVLEKELNSPVREKRIEAACELGKMISSGEIVPEKGQNDVNNHIHTSYSFSPYSPSAAAYFGFMAGLSTVGIMDHDSVGGCEEFVEATKHIGIASTCGAECRVSVKNSPFEGKKINNPDQLSVIYCSLHGIPHTQFQTVAEYFRPITAARIERNRKMTGNLNAILAPFDISVDFDNDIVPLSEFKNGGSITERHILFAVSKKITEKFGRGEKVADFLENSLKYNVSAKIKGYLSDPGNRCYEYDLLGVLKSDVTRFYIDANEDECPDVSKIINLASKTGSIMAYPYLGDITTSVTGDKRAQKFEDDFLEDLIAWLKKIGFNAITYMPSRNTIEQLRRLRALCDKYGFFQISGEDINTPRQNFICMAQRAPEFSNLQDAAWALIGHEAAATKNIERSFVSEKTDLALPYLNDRIAFYAAIGKNTVEKR